MHASVEQVPGQPADDQMTPELRMLKAGRFIELSRLQFESFNFRRNHEMKVLLGLVTGLTLSTGFMVNHRALFLSARWPLFAIYGIMWGTYIAWGVGCAAANNKDKYWTDRYKADAEVLLGMNKRDIAYQKSFGFADALKDWSWRAQFIAVSVLFAASWAILFVKWEYFGMLFLAVSGE